MHVVAGPKSSVQMLLFGDFGAASKGFRTNQFFSAQLAAMASLLFGTTASYDNVAGNNMESPEASWHHMRVRSITK